MLAITSDGHRLTPLSLTDKELEKYGYLGIKVKDYDRFSKNEEIGWANLEMRRFTKDKVETKWFSLNYQGRIQLTIEAKGFGANPYGVIFDDFVPSVTFKTFDQEAIYKVLDDVARSLEELTIVQNQIKLTIDTKKKRVESATAMANTLRNYPASASLLSAADRSHLPADQVDLVAHVESQLQTMIKSNDSSEDEIVLNTLNQRVISLQEVQARTQGIQKMRQQLESELSLLRTEMLNADQWAFK